MRKKKPIFDFKKMINLEYPTEYYIALLLGVFFLIVGFNKLLDPHAFAAAIFQGHLMPHAMINVMALLFMSLELVAAVTVVFMAKYRRAGLWILVGLTLVYTGCVGVNLFRDLNTVCGCFGASARAASISYWTLVRNLLPAIAGLFALR